MTREGDMYNIIEANDPDQDSSLSESPPLAPGGAGPLLTSSPRPVMFYSTPQSSDSSEIATTHTLPDLDIECYNSAGDDDDDHSAVLTPRQESELIGHIEACKIYPSIEMSALTCPPFKKRKISFSSNRNKNNMLDCNKENRDMA